MSSTIDWGKKLMTAMDDQDRAIVESRKAELDKVTGPRVGDWVRFPDGMMWRMSHIWDDGVQYSSGGSFCLGNGSVSFSGSLEPSIPLDSLTLTTETRPGNVWIFHHDQWKAHNGVDTQIDFRVYESAVKAHDYYCSRCKDMVPGAHRLEHSPY